MDTKGGTWRGRGCVMNWDIGIDIYTLICIKWITNKNLLFKKNIYSLGTSLAVQWLRLCASNAGAMGLIAGQGAKIPHAVWRGQKIF